MMRADSGAVRLRACNFGKVVEHSYLEGGIMTISKETEAEILRLYHAEKWKQNTIANQLGLHSSTVYRVLRRNGLKKPVQIRSSIADEYVPFIRRTLEKYPKLNATRLFHMVKSRGYAGGVDHFRDVVARHRPGQKAEAYLRLSTLPGEQAQVDWAYFGKLKIGEAERRLVGFVMVLAWSRRVFLRFYFGDCTANFLRGHVEAFEHFQNVPREILYDNLKSAVLERFGTAIHFNQELLSLAAHYRFAPKPVPVARANEKGRVERAIRYIRSSFFAARTIKSLDELNREALEWCEQEAVERKCPGNNSLTVAAAFYLERNTLLPLPDVPYPVHERKAVQVGKTPYVRFDLNDYSVPHDCVRKLLTVEATPDRVCILDGVKQVAAHVRSFDKGKQIEDEKHVAELVLVKKQASKHRGMNRLNHVAPSCTDFFKRAAERGHNMGRLTQLLIRLLDLYGAAELEAALAEVLAAGSIHSAAIQETLEKRRRAKGLAPPVLLRFAKSSSANELSIVPKSLAKYDELLIQEGEDSE